MTSETPIANPYVGPRTFSFAERQLFFGREREARDLLARVLSERLLLFYAQSGAGKSSLLNTRLIPQLQEERGFVVLPLGRVGGELPVGVEQVDNVYAFNLMLSIDAGNDPARLAHLTLAEFLARLARRTIADASGRERKGWVYDAAPSPGQTVPGAGVRRYALLIDQFEEIITAHPAAWREREDFFQQLDRAMEADPNLWVVLTLREDFVAALDPYAPLLADHLRGRFYMERMGREAALEAIKQPAARFGRPFAPGVAETLLNDLSQVRVPGQKGTVAGQYVEPVQLQVVCYQLWESIKDRPRGSISSDDLREAGDVDHALIQFYQDTIKAVLAEPAVQRAGVSERQLRLWFDKDLITDEGGRDLVRQGEEETAGLPNVAVAELQRRFLLRADARGGDSRIELVHDRFVEPIKAANLDWRAQHGSPLSLATDAWLAASKDPGLLYDGTQLRDAGARVQANPDDFSPEEQEFVKAGQAMVQTLAARRQRRILMGAVSALIVLLALTAWALLSAFSAQTANTALAASASTALADRALAQAASTAAVAGRDTAQVARAEAVSARASAEAAGTAQVMALNALAANLEQNLTAQASAALQLSAMPVTASPTAPSRTPLPLIILGTGRPTGTPAPSTRLPSSPTLDQIVVAQQAQLAQVRATLVVLAPTPTATPCPSTIKVGGDFSSAYVMAKVQQELGCPRSEAHNASTSYERFEHGFMFWRQDTGRIYAFYAADNAWQEFADSYVDGQPVYSCPDISRPSTPPTPKLGFGKVWCTQRGVRSRLGEALSDEISGTHPVQDFDNGSMVLIPDYARAPLVLYGSSGRWQLVR